ncbi:MAG: hypothetical protein HC848_05400 [Limnobacter sp.]|nr:hypothetical protein [Limnobacter sp.]
MVNCRGALPVFFHTEPQHLSDLDEADFSAILDCYREVATAQNTGSKTYCLKNIPWKFKSALEGFGEASPRTAGWIESCYAQTDSGYVLQVSDIPEQTLNEIQRVLSGNTLPEYARYRASLAFDKLANIARPPVFHCTVFNDTKHYYFYGKRHEHIPGIMLMEIARQAFYAHFYRFNHHTRESVNISILSFNCEFGNYLQSNYPLFVQVETLTRIVDGALRETQHLRATFIQRDMPACTIEMTGTLVSNKLFKKLRSTKPPATDAFSTICNETKTSALLHSACGRFFDGVLSVLSSSALIVQVSDLGESASLEGNCKFHLFTQHFGMIAGSGTFAPDDPRRKEGSLVVHITDWNKGAEARFKEFVKMDCFLIQPDEMLAEPTEGISSRGTEAQKSVA